MLKQLLKMADVTDLPVAGLGTSTKMINEKPDVVLRVVRAKVKGLKYIKDPQEQG